MFTRHFEDIVSTQSLSQLALRSPMFVCWAYAKGHALVIVVTLVVNNAKRYYSSMIISFGNKDTQLIAEGIRVPKFSPFEKIARRKLRQLEVASVLSDLRVPPGNRLEALQGDRKGQYSIRINDQYRVCFCWRNGGAEQVEIVDYH